MKTSNLLAPRRKVIPKKGVTSLWLLAGKSQELENVERGNSSSGRLSPCHVTCPTEYEPSRILNIDLSIPRILTGVFFIFLIFLDDGGSSLSILSRVLPEGRPKRGTPKLE